ncbi:MAG: hypothetical protein KF886_09905 [Candidatus Hydrogenedentes bacterium]|nr:hypothetical protein [Candidatus Hydrogenedentota bacterium]
MGMMLSLAEALPALKDTATTFARIENPEGVFPPCEIVPLGPIYPRLDAPPTAILLDMDGTITQTEPLFLHGVEEVVRRVTGWESPAAWAGLDPARDYPKIVGFSTLRNLEYLYGACADAIQPERFFREALRGLVYLHAHDAPRETVHWLDTLTTAYGLEAWRAFADRPGDAPRQQQLINEAVGRFAHIGRDLFARLGLIIFHAGYIETLEKVNRGEGAEVSRAIYGDPSVPAIAPMAGIPLLCALVKGWLPADAASGLAEAIPFAEADTDTPDSRAATLKSLCRHFETAPIPVGLVTSSGTHEVALVLRAVFRAMTDEARSWPLPAPARDRILEGFAHPDRLFETMVTCDDVAGGRTKPFRDPYSLALNRLGLDDIRARYVIGFEDTEAGIIAQRGAGIGVPCAVPIPHTLHHDFTAAAHRLPGGIPQAIFQHSLFFQPQTT